MAAVGLLAVGLVAGNDDGAFDGKTSPASSGGGHGRGRVRREGGEVTLRVDINR